MKNKNRIFFIILFITFSIFIFYFSQCGADDDAALAPVGGTSTSYNYPPIPEPEVFENPIFPNTKIIDIGDQFKQKDENGYLIPLSRKPTITWESTGLPIEAVAIFKNKILIRIYSDGRQEIANFEDCVWAWHSNMPSSKPGYVEYDEGSVVLSGVFPENRVLPEPLDVRLYDFNKDESSQVKYYIAIWAWDSNGNISASSALWEFYTRPDGT